MNSYWSLAVYAGLLMAVAAGALILSALVGEGRFRRRKMQVPWAVVYKQLGVFGLIEMGVFLSVLAFGLAYVWKRGALEWD